MFRIGEFYPELTPDFSYDDCPQYWQDHKIKINVLNMGNENYMKNIQISSYVGIALDLCVGITFFILIWLGNSISSEIKSKIYKTSEKFLDSLTLTTCSNFL